MSKIKLNLDSGSVLEKKLINAFQTPEGKYVVFDDENVGSMGLPIILISKILDNKVIKIEDTGEWQQVKEHLKNIIAGSEMQFVTLPSEIKASDAFFTQLTLPIQSFDALKANYKVEGGNEPAPTEPAPEPAAEPVPPIPEPVPVEEPAPIPEPIPVEEPAPIPEPVAAEPVPLPEIPQTPVEEPSSLPEIPNVEDIKVDEAPPEVAPEPTPEPAPEPATDFGPTIVENKEDPYKEIKESFMQACENVFDGLIIKLEKKE